MKLFLDDIRIPRDVFTYIRNSIYLETDWIIVRDYDSFVKFITENGLPDLITFDHDLGIEHYPKLKNPNWSKEPINYDKFSEKTGYDCAKWLMNYILDNNIKKLPEILIHTQNPVGGKNIKGLMDSLRKFLYNG